MSTSLMLVLLIAVLLVTVLVFIGLITVNTRDSSGKVNNSLLVLYLGVAIWAATTLAAASLDVASAVVLIQSATGKSLETELKNQATKQPSLPRPTPSSSFLVQSSRAHYIYAFLGLLVLACTYVIRRREWARLVIDGINAWKHPKSKDYAIEMLVQHGIENQQDREWVDRVITLLKQGVQNNTSESSISREDLENH